MRNILQKGREYFELRSLSLATRELFIGGLVSAARNRLENHFRVSRRKSVERMCLFAEGDQHRDKNFPQLRPVASKSSSTAPRRLAQV